MSLQKLIADINAAANAPLTEITDKERSEILLAADKLRTAYERPFEVALRILLGIHAAAITRVAVDLKLFDIAASSEGGQVTIEKLASAAGADALLTKRLMRMLHAINMFKEIDSESYVLSPIGAGFVTQSPLSAVTIHLTQVGEMVAKIPTFLEKTGYRNPTDAYNSPFQLAMGTDLLYWDWLKSMPREQEAFNITMSLNRATRGINWFEFYPVEEKLVVESDSDIVLVDVGGGVGHDLTAFHEKYPALKGKLILQDLPIVIGSVKDIPTKIEALSQDFFQPQQIKGAKAYYLRSILHDWPDKQALEILARIKEAMDEKSILLVNENATPEVGASLFEAQGDIQMMAAFGSSDRTSKQFEELLDTAGFTLVKIWKPEVHIPGMSTLFEVVLKN
ncbi:O-methyltransferase-domain-containing protein [Rhexocercosporidium sp. MPI-PUGE-AT-0058]|nr:O-methyltransferase-domain-containing protein [Rhexocercosporidium sp. MPI-PUGE-AT-0058]